MLKPNKITIIISVYKNVEALDIIFHSLKNQTVLVDEIIISEDGDSDVMKNFVEKNNAQNIVHLLCEDVGWRKNVALNKAIVTATGDYLIFIDGDVVPHKRFVEGHVRCSEINKVCVGKRAELGKKYSDEVYKRTLNISTIAANYFKWIVKLHKDKIHHYEDGIYSSLLNKLTSNRYIRHIIGCNFSCFKEDLLKINGFNEDFIHPSEGEDVDITWRLRKAGIEMKSCRYIANVYHLWHNKGFGDDEGSINRAIMHHSMIKNEYICLNGIQKLQKGEIV